MERNLLKIAVWYCVVTTLFLLPVPAREPNICDLLFTLEDNGFPKLDVADWVCVKFFETKLGINVPGEYHKLGFRRPGDIKPLVRLLWHWWWRHHLLRVALWTWVRILRKALRRRREWRERLKEAHKKRHNRHRHSHLPQLMLLYLVLPPSELGDILKYALRQYIKGIRSVQEV
ncbi:uncharacterized protein [Periplaneta americana]|uniref:uncharacterized protein n=1 Tax=Periplaneta americana TaxID=6978 RepID=UPI0037E83062